MGPYRKEYGQGVWRVFGNSSDDGETPVLDDCVATLQTSSLADALIEHLEGERRLLVIDVSGGVVQEVWAPSGFEVVLIDHDNMQEGDPPCIYPNATLADMDEDVWDQVRVATGEGLGTFQFSVEGYWENFNEGTVADEGKNWWVNAPDQEAVEKFMALNGLKLDEGGISQISKHHISDGVDAVVEPDGKYIWLAAYREEEIAGAEEKTGPEAVG